MFEPLIIQGGMGVGVSNWRLARTVSQLGQLGVVSGTSLDVVLSRNLQLGDLQGNLRRAMSQFPYQDVVKRVMDLYFIEGGKAPSAPYKPQPLITIKPTQAQLDLTVLGNFVEVFLAKEGHSGCVGINLLEKIQLPTLPSIFGAMLAGIDYVLMGAGIPKSIPGILDSFSRGEPAELKLDVAGTESGEAHLMKFDPASFCGGTAPKLNRPNFLAIISSATLALTLAKKSSGKVNGFIVEGATAGGHNAPPRGQMQLNEKGEPIYGPRDTPDLVKIRDIGLPFWLAGSYASPEKVTEARSVGAAGIQVGTAFAFCDESGIIPDLKRKVIEESLKGNLEVFTDPLASPTGFPFKVIQLEGTLADDKVYDVRSRICDLGYLRHAFKKANGDLGYRCPSEPVEIYQKKGGELADTEGRMCVCNGLFATIGIGQQLDENKSEPPLLTAGDDAVNLRRFVPEGKMSYSAADVISYLLGNK